MDSQDLTAYQDAQRLLHMALIVLVGIVMTLGALHLLFGDVKAGDVRWFNLDKERNIATWFSGIIFFLTGCAAFVAWYWEQKLNKKHPVHFRLPALWFGVAIVALFMSLDETTILHENLFWREVRQASGQFGDAMKYITQWQLLFAPAIVISLGYFVFFFLNRFSISKMVRRWALGGIGCWIVALLLEGARLNFKYAGPYWYTTETLVEEGLEMIGGILLLFAIISYILEIALNFSSAHKERLSVSSGFLTQKSITAMAVIITVLFASGAVIYSFAQKQATQGAPVPRLFRKATQHAPRPKKRLKSFHFKNTRANSERRISNP